MYFGKVDFIHIKVRNKNAVLTYPPFFMLSMKVSKYFGKVDFIHIKVRNKNAVFFCFFFCADFTIIPICDEWPMGETTYYLLTLTYYTLYPQ